MGFLLKLVLVAQKDDDLEDGFSELETPAGDGNEDDLLDSDTDLSDDNEDVEEPHNELELSDAEIDQPAEKKKKSRPPRHRRAESELYKEIMDAPGFSIHTALNEWVKEGKELSRQEISLAMSSLRMRQMYGRALQLSEWLESTKQLEFIERDYASRIDLIAKNNLKKAEEIFSKMKDLDFPVATFTCNQLLLLYKRNNKMKIADVLLLMQNENVKPSLLTYKILIDAKGHSHDVAGMDQILDKMKAQGFEPDNETKAVVAGHYISAGLEDKAETLLKEMEGENLNQNRWVCPILLPLYATWERWMKLEEFGRSVRDNPGLMSVGLQLKLGGS
ncbi:Tetratricopeptide-like helical domain superfamily [Sesbania bispinosa]|nr:Tetratricopeptide-like helical domain superfamily [Sesbania bispinosa]